MSSEVVEPIERQDVAAALTGWPPSLRAATRGALNLASQRGVLSVADQAIVSGTSFLTAAIIARACTTEQLGLYYLTMSLVLILTGIQEQVITAPYTIYRARHQGPALAEYTGSVWLHHLMFIGISWILLLVAIPTLSALGASNFVAGLWVLLLVGPLLLVREAVRRFAFAHFQFASAMALDGAIAVVQLTSILLLARLKLLSIGAIFGVIAAACALACCGWILLKLPDVRVNRARVLRDWRDNWSFAQWALPSFLVGNTTPLIMAWIVTLMDGTAATGLLGACAALVGVVNVFILGVANALTPRTAHAFARGGVDELRRVLITTALMLIAVLGMSFLAMLFAGDQIAVLVYGEQFRGSGPTLATLALSVVATSVGMTTGNGLWALGLPRANLIPDLCGLIVTLLGAVMLVHPYGALGAAIAMLAGTTTAATARTAILLRAMNGFRLQTRVA
ncbi:MAG TPA: lipopolysaccharide biosynthesis protein [Pirellulales bacterium]|jgi:O-antigen/teichoic acid export membrane protein